MNRHLLILFITILNIFVTALIVRIGDVFKGFALEGSFAASHLVERGMIIDGVSYKIVSPNVFKTHLYNPSAIIVSREEHTLIF